MKNLLIILVLFAGINCQAQTTVDAVKQYTETITETFRDVYGELKRINALNEIALDRISTQGTKIRMLEYRINELEKKVNKFEQKHIGDSIKFTSDSFIMIEEDIKPDTIWIDSEMDFFNGKIPVIMRRRFK